MYRIFKINELGEQTIKHLYSIKEQIDFFPSYQRFGNIWSLQKKQLLIDTIINKFDIPKFYLNYFIESSNELNVNNSLYAIIDGKQRLQAIFDFLDNKYPLSPNIVFLDNPRIQLGLLKYQDILLHYPHIAPIIENYILDVIFITTDEEDRLEELFLRLNGGVALTNAEKRNAIPSYLNIRIRQIIGEHTFFIDKLKFNNPRYQYNDLLSKLLFIELNRRLVNLGNKEIEDFLRLHNQDDNSNNELIDNSIRNLDLLSEVFYDKDILLKSKGLIPVYYQFVKDKINISNPNQIRAFFESFEQTKINNRQLEEPFSLLQEFDRLNQQGVHREKSLVSRYRILEAYFHEFLTTGNLNQNISISDIELDDSENFDEF